MAPSSKASTSSHTGSSDSSSSSTNSREGGLFKRSRPLVAVFHESANAYSSRKVRVGDNNTSMRKVHDDENSSNGLGNGYGYGKGSKRTPKIITNIKKSLANVKRWPSTSPTSATFNDINGNTNNVSHVSYLFIEHVSLTWDCFRHEFFTRPLPNDWRVKVLKLLRDRIIML